MAGLGGVIRKHGKIYLMIRHLGHNEIDKAAWDECLLGSANGMIYGCSWYLDIVSPGWNALILDGYKAVMPLPWKSKFGIQYLYQPFFCQQLGVFGKDCSEGLVRQFLHSIPRRYRYVDIYLNENNRIGSNAFNAEERATQYLDLSPGYSAVYEGYEAKLKRDIRKAGECGLHVEEIMPSDVVEMFRTALGNTLRDLRENDYTVLLALIKAATEKGLARNLGVRANGRLCASACFFDYGRRVMYFKSSSLEEGRKVRAMHFLLDHCIQSRAGSDKTFDFVGSVVPSIQSFFKSFGAQDRFYQHIRINNLPWYIKWFKN
jgi:hypothetical protein